MTDFATGIDHAVKREPEYPYKQRHYFVAGADPELKNGYIDVTIERADGNTIVTIYDWGVLLDGKLYRPSYITPERLEAEKKNVCLK